MVLFEAQERGRWREGGRLVATCDGTTLTTVGLLHAASSTRRKGRPAPTGQQIHSGETAHIGEELVEREILKVSN
jgi:hypothetical protein